MAQTAHFWDRHATGYAKRPVGDETAYQKKLKVTQGYLRPGMDVLEFGCGTGTTALHHAPFVRHVRATDLSGKMLQIARAKAEAADIQNVTFEQSSVEALTADDASYDVVMGHSILHLVDNRQAVMAKVFRLLKPGGVFVSSTVCLGGTMWALRLILPIGRFFRLVPMVKFLTVDDLENSLTEAGFRIDYQWQPDKSKAVFIVAKKV